MKQIIFWHNINRDLISVACNRNAPMFRSRGTRGRGVGLARGRATVNRARGQRGARAGG